MASDRILEQLNIKKTIKLPSGTGFTPQSLGFVNKTDRVVFCSGTSPNQVLRVDANDVNKLGKKISTGHANGGTYCKKNQCFYTTAYEGSNNKKKIHAYDSNFNHKFTLTLDHTATGLAYDPITTQFYVSSGSNVYIYPYEAFQSKGKVGINPKSFKKSFMNDTRSGQDLGGYNGVVMVCRSFEGQKSQRSFIDCYNANTGKYLKSYYSDYGELESVAVDAEGCLHVLFAQQRKLVKTSSQFNLKGAAAVFSSSVVGSVPTNVTETYAGDIIVAKACSYEGQGPDTFIKYGNFTPGDPWCAEFVWCILDMCGYSSYVMNGNKFSNCRTLNDWLAENAETVYNHSAGGDLSNAMPGDIIIFSWNGWSSLDHTGFIRQNSTSNNSVNTVEGNSSNKVKLNSRNKSCIYAIYRPGYSSATSSYGVGFFASPDKLYSSENFQYREEEEDSEQLDKSNEALKKFIKNAQVDGKTLPSDSPALIKALQAKALDDNKRLDTRVAAKSGVALPQVLNYVEAPFIELEIGGFVFGTKQGSKYPNYIENVQVVKTNGSMNEYAITLVHQIQYGDNPNFIDELLSINTFNKIKIKYGDSDGGVIFRDDEALLIGASSKFDFVNCNITYILSATSSAIAEVSIKQTYQSVTDQPSNVVRTMLYDTEDSTLLKMFPGMADKEFVAENNLLPTNDAIVDIPTVINTNDLSYLKYLISLMTPSINTNDSLIQDSSYFLTLIDGPTPYFKVTEISTKGEGISSELLYEVDINYPEPNVVYNFNVSTDYAWAMSYDMALNVTNYNYQINGVGNINKYQSTANTILSSEDNQSTALQKNWWTQMTRFPITATLEVKGLTTAILLLTYIRINSYYYGAKRVTSGLYIVTGQVDTLSQAGYRTQLQLTRVASDNEYIDVDGRFMT